MAKDPERRPPTACGFLGALEEAIDDDAGAAEAPTAVTAPVALTPRAPVAPRTAAPPATPPPRAAPTRRRWPGLAALAALAVVAGAAIAIAAGTGGGSPDGSGRPATRPPAHSTAAKSAPAGSQPQAQPTPKPKTQATPPAASQSASRDPVALNNQGFSLIQGGQPAQAVAPLQRSVDAFRAQGRKGEIDYAYALFNLGNALRLSRRPADAIPYLQERLAVSNYKRGVVKKELKTARAQAGQGQSG
jgi:tetratricopeptide (TPR) repeat protein